jgi:hypothetical protein
MLLRILVVLTVLLGGAALTTGTASAQTPQECDLYAKDYANWFTGGRFEGAAFAGAVGGIFGAVAGEIIANRPGLGGLIGAGIGVGINRAANQPEWQAAYNRASDACLSGTLLPYPGIVAYNWDGGVYATDDPRWFLWCEQTYGQWWDPWTGTWLAADGNRYPCIVQ